MSPLPEVEDSTDVAKATTAAAAIPSPQDGEGESPASSSSSPPPPAAPPTAPPPTTTTAKVPDGSSRRSINSHYGNAAGSISTVSLLLNSGLMLYAHFGPLGEIYSSRDPDSSSSLSPAAPRSLSSATRSVDPAGSGGNATTATSGGNGTATSGKCTSQDDADAWAGGGGPSSRPEMSNYCSREYGGGCFLDAGCIGRCFAETYGFSDGCSECFGAIPTCSVASGCLMAWSVLPVAIYHRYRRY